jgi:signal transduction histidine kinase
MGLEEVATVISIGGLSVMIVSGQFRPPEGLRDLRAALSCLGARAPQEADVSSPMWQSICRFKFPAELWTGVPLGEEDRQRLLSHVEDLAEAESEMESKLQGVAGQIADIAQQYYENTLAEIEGRIMQKIADVVSGLVPSDGQKLREGVDKALGVVRDALDISYVAFYSGETEGETILTLKAADGPLPKGSKAVTFNWRKARIKADDGHDTRDQVLDWSSLSLSHRAALSRGFRGAPDPFPLSAALVPARLPGGPFGLLVFGPHNEGVNLADHERFVLAASRRLATRILMLQLAQILHAERDSWEKTTRLTGHRVRAAVQSVGSQLRTIEGHRKGEAGYTTADRDAAERDLGVALLDLKAISYAAESSIGGALGVKSDRRELVSPGDIVQAAVEAQQVLAEEQGIDIQVSPEFATLLAVWVNPTLMRFAFLNLINNGLKYSYRRYDGGRRFLTVEPGVADPGEVRVKVVNFGLGIKKEDRERIFEWGVRLAPEAPPRFREIYGKGIGLWETKHIIEGHGGGIYVESVHYSKAPVADENIQECITVFTVVLPVGQPSTI